MLELKVVEVKRLKGVSLLTSLFIAEFGSNSELPGEEAMDRGEPRSFPTLCFYSDYNIT